MLKKALFALIVFTMGIFIASCSEDEKENIGSIYGVVTDSKTAEPLRAIGVELYKGGSLLLKTVTYDDGHFQFNDLHVGEYELKVVADGYNETEYTVTVEGGRTARADMQVSPLQTHMTVCTVAVEGPTDGVITFKGSFNYDTSSSYLATEVGFIYGTSKSIGLNDGTIIKRERAYKFECSVKIYDLTNGTWYVKAYAKNEIGYEFGELIQFEVNLVPEVKTLNATNIEVTTATINGLIVYEGNPKYSEKGFVYSYTFPQPSIDDPSEATTKVSIFGESKEFSANISGLTKNKTYYVRAYAKNSNTVVYGDSVSFTPHGDLPEVKTLDVTNIEATSATLNGLIILEGKPKYTEKGFVYSSSYNMPTIDDPESVTAKVSVDGNSNEFSANVADLTEKKDYYVRAYAKHSDGVVYGEVIRFSATSEKPFIIIDNLAIQSTDLSGGTPWGEAESLCRKSRIGGFSDWRLPTLGELSLMYQYREEIGGFNTEEGVVVYWSSSYNGVNYPYYYYGFDFSDGSQSRYYDDTVGRVRAVRTIK